MNHYRPEFFTRCPNHVKVCYTFTGKQRGIYPIEPPAAGGLLWAGEPLRRTLAAMGAVPESTPADADAFPGAGAE